MVRVFTDFNFKRALTKRHRVFSLIRVKAILLNYIYREQPTENFVQYHFTCRHFLISYKRHWFRLNYTSKMDSTGAYMT